MKFTQIFIKICLVFTLVSCDSTVTIDTTLPSLTDVYVSSACLNQEDNVVELSVSLINKASDEARSVLIPSDQIAKETKSVGELVTPSTFTLTRPANAEDIQQGFQENGFTQSNSGDFADIAMTPQSVQFQYVADDEKLDQKTLVIFLLDQSGSHIGEKLLPDGNTEFKPETASDLNHNRFTLIKQVIRNMPSNYFVSLIDFKKDSSNYSIDDPDSIVEPIANSDSNQKTKIEEYFKKLSSSEQKTGGTPLKQALVDTLDLIDLVKKNPSGQNTKFIVVLHTDGLETGDTSISDDANAYDTLDDLAYEFADRKTPLHVIHLQPSVLIEDQSRRGPKSNLANLACLTTGDYFFVPKDTDLTKKDIEPHLISRMIGRWKLSLQAQKVFSSELSSDQGYYFSTDIQVELGGEVHNYEVANQSTKDRRLWFYKY